MDIYKTWDFTHKCTQMFAALLQILGALQA